MDVPKDLMAASRLDVVLVRRSSGFMRFCHQV